jgi:dolichol-phosphate mannosyltransferase
LFPGDYFFTIKRFCMARPVISIIAPLWNESPNVLPLAERVFQAMHGEERGIELILVDDASTDDTWQRILEARSRDQRVRPVRHLKQSGQSAALCTGFKISHGEIIATLDGDLQNDPSDFPRMLSALHDSDMVCGVRMRRMDTWVRKASSKIARAARKSVLGSDFRDTGCNLRVFRRTLLDVLPQFNGLHRFMPILAHGAGARVEEISVTHHPRVAGKSKYGVWNRLGRGIYDLIAIRWFLKRQLYTVKYAEHEAIGAAALTDPASRENSHMVPGGAGAQKVSASQTH